MLVLRRVAALVMAGLASTVALAAPAQAGFSTHAPLRNDNDTGMCMGVSGGSNAAGAEIRLFRCVGGGNQDYKFLATTTNAILLHANNGSGNCVGVKDGSFANDAQLVLVPCSRSDARWIPIGTLSGTGKVTFRNAKTGRCIGVDGGSTAHGARIAQYTCGDTTRGNQVWHSDDRAGL
ncbi:RICIN domain-containing protein [Nonomuraea endophytica]|uniref:Ricin B lectin domain-containing protein n=1 Tax=Nonomuraea endophytica TaxID=714136 RepID=A0A7W8EFC6_9ACTN|nr:RICIN domain-containing protein [Nonomuraea endophytica]MBB5076332.1 hypothetical protein [Nonomuraea endophytica]